MFNLFKKERQVQAELAIYQALSKRKSLDKMEYQKYQRLKHGFEV
ncbi:hypothetical protein [Gracilibacillus alcaliphilus]|nr:hypothetical protein [Gracilibacillus alcaliphilus]MBM7676332.1 hypothetical protein [Gracilibacillus alcaliphilus]